MNAITTTTVKPSIDRSAIIDGVFAHASKKGTHDGWDIVLGWDRQKVDTVMGIRTKSVLGAVQMLAIFGGFREANKARVLEAAYDPTEQVPNEVKAHEEDGPDSALFSGFETLAEEGGEEGEAFDEAPVKKAKKGKKAA